MKTNLIILRLIYVLFCFVPGSLLAQDGLVFRNPSLYSGSALQANAVYKYANVSPGTDAFITIVSMTNGISLASLDENNSGYEEAFQPVLNCPAGHKAYIEFRIDFVESAHNSIEKVMAEIAMTGIDITSHSQSGNPVYEFNQFKTGTGTYADYNSSSPGLLVLRNTGWYEAIGQSPASNANIDTADKDHMFSLISHQLSSVTFRVGMDNRSASGSQSHGSIYFKKFTFSNRVLPMFILKSFRGAIDESRVSLNWDLTSSESIKTIVVEKTYKLNEFHPIAAITVTDENRKYYTHTDNHISSSDDAVYYRLKFITKEDKFTHSKVLIFHTKRYLDNTGFTIFPTVFTNDITLRVKAERNVPGLLRIINMAGTVACNRVIYLQTGYNSIIIDETAKLPAGNYIAVFENDGQISSQKIIKL